MRGLAYQEGVSLFGPTTDPDGWFSCEPIIIRGKVFNNRTSQVKSTVCTVKMARVGGQLIQKPASLVAQLFLAKPVSPSVMF